MQIDTAHLHHWMRAIRQSQDPMRTMDAFWSGQIRSKEWLIEHLRPHVKKYSSVDIHGGWVGVLASMLFQSGIPVTNINSIDIDEACEPIANTMNQIEYEAGRFKAITRDMCEFTSVADIVINTSFEHITETQYHVWLDLQPRQSIVVLQSNNYNIPEHIRIADSLEQFVAQTRLDDILYKGELDLPLYKRFMIIGKRNV